MGPNLGVFPLEQTRHVGVAKSEHPMLTNGEIMSMSVSVSVNAAWNSVVLTARRNDCSDEGRAFQARAPATGKARSQIVTL